MRLYVRGEIDWRQGCEYWLSAVRACLDQGVCIEVSVLDHGPDRERAWFTRSDLSLESAVHFLPDRAACTRAESEADLVLEVRLGESARLREPAGGVIELPPRDPDALATHLLTRARREADASAPHGNPS